MDTDLNTQVTLIQDFQPDSSKETFGCGDQCMDKC